MPVVPPKAAAPTARQAEYLTFIRAFTERWGIPPSFEEIGRHFMTTAPSVNSMVKTLERRGFLTRIPGQARTLRVIVAADPKSPGRAAKGSVASNATDVTAAVQMAGLVVERLVPVLKSAGDPLLHGALDAVSAALETTLKVAGASEDQEREAQDSLRRVALVAQGMSPETRPGRRHPWWRRPR